MKRFITGFDPYLSSKANTQPVPTVLIAFLVLALLCTLTLVSEQGVERVAAGDFLNSSEAASRYMKLSRGRTGLYYTVATSRATKLCILEVYPRQRKLHSLDISASTVLKVQTTNGLVSILGIDGDTARLWLVNDSSGSIVTFKKVAIE